MVNDNIKAAIEASGIKQKFIADKVGITENMLSAIITGRRKISADEFFRISDVLGMEAKDLFNYPIHKGDKTA